MGAVGDDLRALADALPAVVEVAVGDALDDAAGLARASFGRVRLRAFGTVEVHGDNVVGRLQGVPVGPWSILSYGARRHLIRARARRRGRPLLVVGGRPVWGPVTHPGMAGNGAWDRVVTRAGPALVAAVDDAVTRAVAHA